MHHDNSSYVSFNYDEAVSPKVTIGFCVRNCETSLRDAFMSTLSQDFPKKQLEFLFVDDGSEDNTFSLIEKLASTINVPTRVYHTEWRGVGHARNIVVQNARGQYIIWVDGDMTLSRDYVSKLVKLMDSNEDMGIVKGKQSLEPGGNRLATLETYARVASRMVDYSSDKNRSKSLGTGGAIYRVAALRQVGLFDENLRGYGEDQDVEMRMRKMGWKLSVADCLFQDHERFGLTRKALYRRYYSRGFFSHYFVHKNPGSIKINNMMPYAIFAASLFQAQKLFRLTHSASVFLLPFHNVSKMFAWYVGFLHSHYGSFQPQ